MNQYPSYEYTLAERDSYLVQIETQIEAKRNLLLGKRKFLENTLQQNQFLEGVKNDYHKYYDYIAKQKMEELRAMDILKQYTNDLIMSTQLTEYEIAQTKRDQQEIVNEMTKIKKALDEIVEPVKL